MKKFKREILELFKNKNIHLRAFSIKAHFIFFSLIIIILVSALYFYFSWKSYSKNVLINLQKQSVRIERSFVDTLDYSVYLMGYIDSQIKEHDSKDLKYIKNLLTSFRPNNEANNKIPWNMFSWVNRDLNLVANSSLGIVNPINVSERDYISKAVDNPGIIQFGKPSYGKVSGQWIIPSGAGVVDKKGKFLGVIVFGFQIEKFIEKLSQSVNFENVSFAIYDARNMQMVLNSNNFSTDSKYTQLIGNLNLQQTSGELTRYSIFGNNDSYSFFQRVEKYPYVIVTKYDHYITNRYFLSLLYPYFFEILIIILILVLILQILKIFVINPIVQLHKVAEAVSQNRDNEVKQLLPKTDIKEIANLSNQLQIIQEYKLDLISAKSSQERFFANMSHELRTPLNGILNFSQMMRKEMFGPINADYKEMLNDIYASGEHLLNLVNDILDFAKMDIGKMQLREEQFDLIQEINESVKIIAEDAKQNGVKIITNIDHSLRNFFGDRRMFKQIMLNLLSNAVKFTDSGGEIDLALQTNKDNDLEVIVKDSGVGIKEEDLARIATEFGQVGDGYKRGQKQGTGLGLALTKKMAELHGGKFLIESVFGEGTKVIIILPGNRIIKNS